MGVVGVAHAQVDMTVPLSGTAGGNINYQLVGRNTMQPCAPAGSAQLRVSADGMVWARDVQIDASPLWQSTLFFTPQPAVPCSVQGLAVRRQSPGSLGTPVQGSLTGDGRVMFSNLVVPITTQGTAMHTSPPGTCEIVQNAGGVCNGPFDLSLSATGIATLAGTLPLSGNGFATLSVASYVSLSPTGATWGTVLLSGFWTATLTGAPACPADFNGVGGVSVQDIFDFLSAWFSNDPRADINGGGVSVQDIFDFLAHWFMGC